MRKIIIAFIILIGLVALVPIVGNTLVKETLDKKMLELESKGIQVTKSSEDVSYLESARHYEFLVKDGAKFLKSLQKYADLQSLPYTNALLGGTLIGVDIRYSNIPLSKAISLDIYPLALPNEMMDDFQKKDLEFAQYIEQFLFNKGILYHINYNLVSKEFDGFVKDVNENYTLKNNAKVVLDIKETNFQGNGDLIAPSYIQVHSKNISLSLTNPSEEMSIYLSDFKSSSNFENPTTYVSSSTLGSMIVKTKRDTGKKEIIDISRIYLNLSSNTQMEKAEINTKFSFENMLVKLDNLDANASDMNYDMGISEMDKVYFEELRILLSNAKFSSSSDFSPQIKQKIIHLLSKGIKVNIVDLSLKNILLDGKDLDGFKISSEVKLSEDPNLAGKMLFSPLFALGNVDLDFKSTTSTKILDEIKFSLPLPFPIPKDTNTSKKETTLDISYKQGSLKINGKSVLGKL